MLFKVYIETKGFSDIIDITDYAQNFLKETNFSGGLCNIFCPGSTCAITLMEYEDGLIKDTKNFFDKIIPQSKDYEHCKKWGDCNGFSHLRSLLLKPSLTVPFENKKLLLGTWQQIVLIDFDNRERKREVYFKFIKDYD